MVYYINFDGLFCSVFDSQMFCLMKLLMEKDIDISLIDFDRDQWKNKEGFNKKFEVIKGALNNKVYLINKIKKGNFYEPLILNRYIKKIEAVVTKGKVEEPVLFHCRGHYASYIALRVKEKLSSYNIKVIIDLRGMVIDEYKEIYGSRNVVYKMFLPTVLNRIGKIEEYIINNSDYIFCVTNTFKEYINERYGISANKIKVIPTCINTEKFKYCGEAREEIRKKLNINDKYVVVYSGAGQSWQQPNVLVEAFIRIKKIIPGAFFLILTREEELFLKYINLYKLSQEDFMITSCSHDEVSKYLSAADLGLLIRKSDGVNKVASPTKFAEYMSCHVPLILSKGIGDLDKFVHDYNIGMYYEEIEAIDEKLLNINRNVNDFEEIVRKYYNWKAKINEIINVYNKVNSSSLS